MDAPMDATHHGTPGAGEPRTPPGVPGSQMDAGHGQETPPRLGAVGGPRTPLGGRGGRGAARSDAWTLRAAFERRAWAHLDAGHAQETRLLPDVADGPMTPPGPGPCVPETHAQETRLLPDVADGPMTPSGPGPCVPETHAQETRLPDVADVPMTPSGPGPCVPQTPPLPGAAGPAPSAAGGPRPARRYVQISTNFWQDFQHIPPDSLKYILVTALEEAQDWQDDGFVDIVNVTTPRGTGYCLHFFLEPVPGLPDTYRLEATESIIGC